MIIMITKTADIDVEYVFRVVETALTSPLSSTVNLLRYLTFFVVGMLVCYPVVRHSFDLFYLTLFVLLYGYIVVPMDTYYVHLGDDNACNSVLCGPIIRSFVSFVHVTPVFIAVCLEIVWSFTKYSVNMRTLNSSLLILMYSVLARPADIYFPDRVGDGGCVDASSIFLGVLALLVALFVAFCFSVLVC